MQWHKEAAVVTQETLGQYLRKLRGNTPLGDFAGRYNLSLRCLQLIEEGKSAGNPVLLRQLAEIHEVSYVDLLARAGYH